MYRILIIATCLLIVISSWGQKKKEVKKNKIKSTTDWEIVYENGKANTYKSAYEEFDKNGNSTMKIEYGPDGAVLTKVTAKYDGFQNRIEETEFDVSKKKNIRKTSKYNAFKDKTEESEYNSSGVLLKKTVFTYNTDGDKTSEIIMDSSGTVLKKTTYTYNPKKLRSGKQTINSSNLPETGKKWEYVYY
jgi:hypothetical protein